MGNTLLVLTRDQDEFEEKLGKRDLPELEIVVPRGDSEIAAALPSANILLGNPPMVSRQVNQAASVKWVQSTFTGVDALLKEGVRKNYILTNVRDAYGPAISEYVFAYILSLHRGVFENLHHQKEKYWNETCHYTIDSKTIGIVGTGSIGKEIARISKSFGMKVLGYRAKTEALDNFDQIYTGEQLPELLNQSDFVIIVLPNTPATTGMVDAGFLSQMKPTATLVNVGRGNVICDADLEAALKEGRIANAVLDVFHEEPLPKEHPFWETPNLYVTPHISGYVNTDRIFDIFEENYQLFFADKPLKYQVDFERGY